MKKYFIVGIVVIVVVGVVLIYGYTEKQGNPTAATTPVSAPAPAGSSLSVENVSSSGITAGAGINVPAPTSAPTAVTAPAPKSFAVNGNDSSADLETITVQKGTLVTITFGADAEGTYHGGLDFRSSVVSTGPIAPGNTKTVSFTAENSFTFTPYWPSTNIAKPYTIKVIVD